MEEEQEKEVSIVLTKMKISKPVRKEKID